MTAVDAAARRSVSQPEAGGAVADAVGQTENQGKNETAHG